MFFLLIGSVISACAMNFGMLLGGRMIQAIGAGIIMPLMMTVILYLYPAEQRGSIMGKIGFAVIFAPAIAPTLSGFIIEFVSWRWLFIGLIPFLIIVIALAIKYLMDVSETSKARLAQVLFCPRLALDAFYSDLVPREAMDGKIL